MIMWPLFTEGNLETVSLLESQSLLAKRPGPWRKALQREDAIIV
jgi:hypothetical protein